MHRTTRHLPSIVAFTLVAVAPAQAAFVVDQVQLRRQGNDAVLEVAFATEVQFQRLIATSDGLSVVISYKLLTQTNRDIGGGSQVMSLEHLQGLDRLRLTDETDRTEESRRLVLRVGSPISATARTGRDNRHIEIVLAGQGVGRPAGEVDPARPPAAAPPRAASSTPAMPPVPPSAPTEMTAADPAVETQARPLIDAARAALAADQPALALEALNPLLNLPPNSATREAQEMAGVAYTRLGQIERAKAEFETFLQLYPEGGASERVRARLAALPSAPAVPVPQAPAADPARPTLAESKEETSTDGSTSMTYYGGNGKLRSEDFKDSPISGLPELVGDPLFSADKSRLLFNDVDLNWRRRSAAVDQRFVVRDSYVTDLERPDKSKNRLSSLYFDHKSRADGWGARVGRQSPLGAGVMGRFDGVQGYVMATPKIKLGAAAGVPTDDFFDSKRRFVGVSMDVDRLVGKLGAGLFAIEQRIDGEIDRRALGMDLRYFDAGLSVFSQFDYDIAIGGLNVATVQGTYIAPDNTVYNALYDRRTLSTLSLGNSLTFRLPGDDPNRIYTRISERLAGTTMQALRDLVRRVTPILTQAQAGVTVPLNAHWQTGGSVQLSNIGAIPPAPEVEGFENGRPASGDIVSASVQLIGLNLYSQRDTHVMSLTAIHSPALAGIVLSYNNSSYVWEDWQLEPSLQYYQDRTPQGSHSRRWTPGLRLTYRGWKRWVLESSLTYEIGRATRLSQDQADPPTTLTTNERTNRVNYSLGARFEF